MLLLHQNPILKPAPKPADTENADPLRGRQAIDRTSTGRRTIDALEISNVARELERLPKREESIHMIARGHSPAWLFVPRVLELAAPAVIESLAIATLSTNEKCSAHLFDLIDRGQIRRVSMLVSNYFEKASGREFQMLAAGLKARGQRIAVARNHAKIFCIALSDKRRMVIESSANLRSNRNYEQTTIIHSAPLFDFHVGWIERVMSAAEGHQ
jgi:hypothetical protein